MIDRGVTLRAALRSFFTATAAAALVAAPTEAAPPCYPIPADGASVLVAGHSFFVPIAESFDLLARVNGFSAHSIDSYFRGGGSGAPLALLENDTDRAAIEAKLADQPDIFGLTLWITTEIEDYEAWIDIALSYNPEVRIFIGVPWLPFTHSLSAEQVTEAVEVFDESFVPIIVELRRRYPGTRIDYVNYGKMVDIMFSRYHAGELPDISCVTPVGCGGGAPLFTDNNLGHAGPMMEQLCALTWFGVLYGADIVSLNRSSYRSDVDGMLSEWAAYNTRFPRPAQDWNNDAECSFFDVACYLNDVESGLPAADLTFDGDHDADDVEMFVAASDGSARR